MNRNLRSRRQLTYDDIVKVPPGKSAETLSDVREYDKSILSEYSKQDMIYYTGETIYVRDVVAKKIADANKKLSKQGKKLKVVYGYRHPEVQAKYFYNRRNELKNEHPYLAEDKLDRLTHEFVAIPEVAGHPTGAAVDITIVDSNNNEIDMGCAIADYTDPDQIKTYFKGLSLDQSNNRALLHDVMVKQGFAPFYGEWWHFSYGDREWAAFYNKRKALYGAIL